MITNNIADFNEKIKKHDLLQPHDEPPNIPSNETILIYDLINEASTQQKKIVLPVSGSSYTIYYDNTESSYNNTNISNFPEIFLYGGKNYKIKISGFVLRFGNFTVLDGVEYLVEAVKLGPLDLSGAFYGAINLIKVPKKLLSGVTNISNMFVGATSFNQPLNNWNVRNVRNMSSMFAGATSFNQPLNNWDVSSVGSVNIGNIYNGTYYGSMKYMFCDAITFNQPLNNWDVSNVRDMSGMFDGATSFNQPLNNWNVSKVGFTIETAYSYYYNGSMASMFRNTTKFNQPLNNWNVSNVRDMSNMFNGATSFNQPLNNWDVSKVGFQIYFYPEQKTYYGSLHRMFLNATKFNQPLHNWNLKDGIDCSNMLDYCGMSQYNYQNTLIGWYNNCEGKNKIPFLIGAKGMVYNNYNKWGVSNNTYGNGAISTNTSWILHLDDPDKNIMRAARSYFGNKIVGDMEVNFG